MKKFIFPLLVFLFTLIIWRPVLKQALIGEGSIYFNPPYLTMLNSNLFSELWSRHDSQALIFFSIVKNIFRTNMRLYMWFLLIGVSFVNISLFFLIKKVTKSTISAGMAVLFFVTNFVGSYEILGLGYYQWFIQRVPNFGLSLISLILLIKFFENKKNIFYYLSFLLYVLSVFLARYSINILPLFVFYSLFIVLSTSESLWQKFIKVSFVLFPFILASYVLYKAQSLVTGSSEITSFQGLINVLPNVFYQLAFLTLPFLKLVPTYLFLNTIKVASVIVSLIYIIITILIVRRYKTKNRILTAFVISLVLCLPLSIFLSIFLNPIFIPYYDSSRYLYYSSLLASSFWGITLWATISLNKKLIFPVVMIVILWVIYNKNILDRNFKSGEQKFLPTLSVVNYFKDKNDSTDSNTLYIVPAEVGYYGSGMLKYFYGVNNRNFQPFISETELIQTIKITKLNVINLKFNFKNNLLEQTNLKKL